MAGLAMRARTVLGRPEILSQYMRWMFASGAGPGKVMTLRDVKVGGFPKFSSYRGALVNQPSQAERDFLVRRLSTGDTAIDVGANFGVFSVLMSRVVGPEGRVFAFEPLPSTFAAMEANLARNGATNVQGVSSALADKTGTTAFTDTADPGTNRMDEAGPITVKVDTLDSFAASESIDRVDFLKVDVEGVEVAVLKGAHRLFSEGRVGTGLIEVCPGTLHRFGASAAEVLGLFKANGYRLFWVEDPSVTLTQSDMEQLPENFLGNAGFERRA